MSDTDQKPERTVQTPHSPFLDPGQLRLLVAGIYGIAIGSIVAGVNYWLFGPNESVALSGILSAVGVMAYLLVYA